MKFIKNKKCKQFKRINVEEILLQRESKMENRTRKIRMNILWVIWA